MRTTQPADGAAGASVAAAPRGRSRDTAAPPAARRSAPAAVSVEGVRITNPQRAIALAEGVTKLGLVDYHVAMAEWLLREIGNRPLGVIRCPGGEIRTCFYQRHANARMPDAQAREGDAPSPPWLHLPSLADVLRAVQNGAFEFHSWSASFPEVAIPDRIVIDLDPDPELPWATFRDACEDVRALLDSLDLAWFAKTTGGKGLHFVLPLERRGTFAQAKAFARGLANRLVADNPSLFLAHAAKADRRGRVFVDYLRNAEGATAVAAYSVRARPGLPVSMPVAWADLARDVRGAHFNVRNAVQHVTARPRDPWQGYAAARQRISAAQRRALGVA